MGKLPDPRCEYCRCAEDTAEHTIFECLWWEQARMPLFSLLGRRTTAEDVEDLMCRSGNTQLPDNHNERAASICRAEERRHTFRKMVKGIMKAKEEDERARQARRN